MVWTGFGEWRGEMRFWILGLELGGPGERNLLCRLFGRVMLLVFWGLRGGGGGLRRGG